MDIIGIHVENDYDRDREFFMNIRFDQMILSEKGSRAHLPADFLISETCSLEESASHHDGESQDFFMSMEFDDRKCV